MNSQGLWLSLLLPLIFAAAASAQIKNEAVFEFHAGDHLRRNVPVSIEVSDIFSAQFLGQMQLVETTTPNLEIIPYQIETESKTLLLWWIVPGETPAGTKRTFALRSALPHKASSNVAMSDTGESIEFEVQNSHVLSYHYALTPVPGGVPEVNSRGGYIHPLKSPGGGVLTRIQPPDHYHHYGIWNPWTRTEFAGREVDFWNLYKEQATIRVKEVISMQHGQVFGNVKAHHEHVIKADSGQQPAQVVLNETLDIRVWDIKAPKKVWVVDVISNLSCATPIPLTIKKYRYQGFSFRGRESWNDTNAHITTSLDKDQSNANGTRARWCDVQGPTAMGPAGITFLTHPANFNFPEHLRIWPTGMNDGVGNVFINYNPAQDRDWPLSPGQTYTLRYRMIVYDGSMGSNEANRYWIDYANPPLVTRKE